MNSNFFVFFGLLCTISLSAQVKISLKNTTGKRIDSLKVGNMYLGTIEIDSVKTIIFEMITCDSEEPLLYFSANIGKEKIVVDQRAYKCATSFKSSSNFTSLIPACLEIVIASS